MEIYVVQPGDTLFLIAQRFGVTVAQLQALNQFPDPGRLVVGQAILIPTTALTPLRYTVVAGDTLYLIAQAFGTSINAIVQANQITDPNRIQVGTVLIIPGWSGVSYTVRPGDTLFAIASRFNTSVSVIAKVNQITNPALIYPGQILIIPQQIAPVVKTNIETLGYFFPFNLAGLERTFSQYGQYLTYGAIFDFRVSATGQITIPNNTQQTVNLMRRFNIVPLMVITNWGPAGTFDSEIGRAIVSNPAVKETVINNVLNILSTYGFGGINVDFENLYPEDRNLFTEFMRDLAAALKPRGYLVTIAMAPKYSDNPTFPWVGFFDYAALGAIVDIAFLMTYEWGWIGGPPMAIAPLNLVRRVLEYAISQMPATKIIQGIPLYGYDWQLPDTPENRATAVNLVNVYNLAYNSGAVINYDTVAQSPWFRYRDAQGIEHEVWFEDVRSVKAKYELAKALNLRGVGYWSFLNDPYGFPQNWAILGEMFQVIKLAG